MERPLRYLIFIDCIYLSLAYVAAWKQQSIAEILGIYPLNFHLSSAGSAVLLHFFTCLCVLFYFIGTGLWIKEQAKAILALDKKKALRLWDGYRQANRLKGWAFPFATFGILLGLFTFILGGAKQVGVIPTWLHPSLATGMIVVAWGGLPFIFIAINRNLGFLDQIEDELPR